MSGSSLDLRTASLEQLKVRATTNERDDDDDRGRGGEMSVDARRRRTRRTDDECARVRCER